MDLLFGNFLELVMDSGEVGVKCQVLRNRDSDVFVDEEAHVLPVSNKETVIIWIPPVIEWQLEVGE